MNFDSAMLEIAVSFLEAVAQRCSVKKVFLKMLGICRENTCARVSFIKLEVSAYKFIEKETLARTFFCEFCERFYSTLFTEHLWVIVSVCFFDFL